jgi:hypothetical protein
MVIKKIKSVESAHEFKHVSLHILRNKSQDFQDFGGDRECNNYFLK